MNLRSRSRHTLSSRRFRHAGAALLAFFFIKGLVWIALFVAGVAVVV